MLPIFKILALITAASACQISSAEIGICAKSTQVPLQFCAAYVSDYICIPNNNVTWSAYSPSYRDDQIQQIFLANIQERIIDEYQNLNASLVLSNNIACFQAYKTFLCQWNFPQCSSGLSKPICISVCSNYFTSCGSSVDACQIIYANTDMGVDSTC